MHRLLALLLISFLFAGCVDAAEAPELPVADEAPAGAADPWTVIHTFDGDEAGFQTPVSATGVSVSAKRVTIPDSAHRVEVQVNTTEQSATTGFALVVRWPQGDGHGEHQVDEGAGTGPHVLSWATDAVAPGEWSFDIRIDGAGRVAYDMTVTVHGTGEQTSIGSRA